MDPSPMLESSPVQSIWQDISVGNSSLTTYISSSPSSTSKECSSRLRTPFSPLLTQKAFKSSEMLVDAGSSCDILFDDTFNQMQVDKSCPKTYHFQLLGFTRQSMDIVYIMESLMKVDGEALIITINVNFTPSHLTSNYRKDLPYGFRSCDIHLSSIRLIFS